MSASLDRRRCLWFASGVKQIIRIALLCSLSAGWVASASALTITNVPVADTFLRSAAPASNYGGAGALSVSGSAAVNRLGQQNGLFDSLMRFSLSGTMSAFDAAYGAGNWTLNSVTLRLTETAAPNSDLFNRGVGQFEIRWLANDLWTEGTGTPTTPTTDGIAYNGLPSLLNAGSDVSLGTFANAGQNTQQGFALPLTDPSFLNDLLHGGTVSLYLTASSSTIGFTFNSRSFATASGRPFLELTASAVPEPAVGGLLALGMLFLTVSRLGNKG
jgi:hypothetical protein